MALNESLKQVDGCVPSSEPGKRVFAVRSWLDLLGQPSLFWTLLVGLWAAVYLTNLGTRDMRLEEGRRVLPAREMLMSGNWVLPTLLNEPYLNKPPFFFWLNALMAWVLGDVSTLGSRLISAVSVLAAAFLVVRFPRAEMTGAARRLAGLLVVASYIMLIHGTMGEIDAFLSVLIVGALAVWWRMYTLEGPTLPGWLVTGVILSIAVLTKGPGGLAQFYPPIIAFLFWQRQWRALFSLGHVLCVVIYLVPTAAWLWLLVVDNGISFARLLRIWHGQVGMGETQRIVNGLGTKLTHYWLFPVQAFFLSLPWGLALLPLLGQKKTKELDRPAAFQRFMLCWYLATLAAFWLWPIGQPRHWLTFCFPLCILTASAVTDASLWQNLLLARFQQAMTLLVALVPLMAGLAAVGFAATCYPPALLGTLAGLLGCLLGTIVLWVLCRRSGKSQAPLTLIGSLAVAMLAGWICFALAFIPWYAVHTSTRISRVMLERHEPKEWYLYKGRHECGNYNLAFYLRPHLIPFRDLNTLPMGQPCMVLCHDEDLATITQLDLEDYTEIERVEENSDHQLVLLCITRKGI